MIIAFDFDGTITKRNEYPDCGEIREGIVHCIIRLHNEGHDIMIFTCRDVQHISQIAAYNKMINYLINKSIPFRTINRNVNPTRAFNPIKPYWEILVDDSALGFDPNWTGDDIYNLIQERIKNKIHNKITYNHSNT